MKTLETPLQSHPQNTALYDLDEDQLETLGSWQEELHEWTECDSMRSRINESNDWATTLGDFTAREIAIAATEAKP